MKAFLSPPTVLGGIQQVNRLPSSLSGRRLPPAAELSGGVDPLTSLVTAVLPPHARQTSCRNEEPASR